MSHRRQCRRRVRSSGPLPPAPVRTVRSARPPRRHQRVPGSVPHSRPQIALFASTQTAPRLGWAPLRRRTTTPTQWPGERSDPMTGRRRAVGSRTNRTTNAKHRTRSREVSSNNGDNAGPPRPGTPDIRVILNRSTRGAVRCTTRRTVLSGDDRCIGPPWVWSRSRRRRGTPNRSALAGEQGLDPPGQLRHVAETSDRGHASGAVAGVAIGWAVWRGRSLAVLGPVRAGFAWRWWVG